VRRVETKREAELRAQGYYDDDEEEFDDPLMDEFEKDDTK
jgi:sec-independent protein translocase protein TatC